ncbi:MAG TPA: hypothetical protein VGN18_02220 [Jatrophihabitans sp.]|uniref:hypothetical protein n=1 Tax=Jatrophihabitans sp. TaxID=1932789 RepID=UPI002E0A0DA5|nr:hypothetical protein [Jatrophihabitans sp.]
MIPIRQCAAYLHAVQQADWFAAAFAVHAVPVAVIGGAGGSAADSDRRRVKIGVNDRRDARRCETSCLHELAHIVTADVDVDGADREVVSGPGTSRGHHHAWRANFVFLVRMTLGNRAASRLRTEFTQWGLPTR